MRIKEERLYNIIFPIWLLVAIPPIVFITLPLNFAIDFAVLFYTMKYLKIEGAKEKTKSVIWEVWSYGFLSDIIGGVFMLLVYFLEDFFPAYGDWLYENLGKAVMFNPFESIWGFLWICTCLLIVGLCIYFFNLKKSFKSLDIPYEDKKKLALSLAILTAPYLYFIPYDFFGGY